MARDAVRPGLTPAIERELLGKRRILINPTLAELVEVTGRVQRGCRKNLLREADLKDLWARFTLNGDEAPFIGEQRCPIRFEYGVDATFCQLVDITPELSGAIVSRERTEPGLQTAIPVSSPKHCARVWLRDVVLTFWTHLTDEEIEAAHQAALTEEMTGTHGRERLRRRRRLQLRELFKGTRPTYVSDREVAFTAIVDALGNEGRGEVPWAEFGRRWPSVAARYRRELTGIVRGRMIQADDLRSVMEGTRRYQLSLDCWAGAQRSFPEPQVVFRIVAAHRLRELARRSAAHASVVDSVVQEPEFTGHPTTRFTVGWLRVHVDDRHRLCFVDEIQSDMLEQLREIAERDPSLHHATTDVARELDDWAFNGFACVLRWAKSIGFATGLHTRESATMKRRDGMSPSDRKWFTYYHPVVRRFGLEPRTVEGYASPIHMLE